MCVYNTHTHNNKKRQEWKGRKWEIFIAIGKNHKFSLTIHICFFFVIFLLLWWHPSICMDCICMYQWNPSWFLLSFPFQMDSPQENHTKCYFMFLIFATANSIDLTNYFRIVWFMLFYGRRTQFSRNCVSLQAREFSIGNMPCQWAINSGPKNENKQFFVCVFMCYRKLELCIYMMWTANVSTEFAVVVTSQPRLTQTDNFIFSFTLWLLAMVFTLSLSNYIRFFFVIVDKATRISLITFDALQWQCVPSHKHFHSFSTPTSFVSTNGQCTICHHSCQVYFPCEILILKHFRCSRHVLNWMSETGPLPIQTIIGKRWSESPNRMIHTTKVPSKFSIEME